MAIAHVLDSSLQFCVRNGMRCGTVYTHMLCSHAPATLVMLRSFLNVCAFAGPMMMAAMIDIVIEIGIGTEGLIVTETLTRNGDAAQAGKGQARHPEMASKAGRRTRLILTSLKQMQNEQD